jgi:hypothetical protein
MTADDSRTAFEQSLLESASIDGPAEDASAAYYRFSARVSFIAGTVEPTSGLRRIPDEYRSRSAASAPQPTVRTAARLTPSISTELLTRAKSIVGLAGVGLVMGGIIAVMNRPPSNPRNDSAPTEMLEAEAGKGPAVSSTEKLARDNPLETPSKLVSPSNGTPSPASAAPPEELKDRHADQGFRPPTAARPPVTEGGPTLAEEVAAIDAARATLRRGRYREALGLIEGYQRRFPEGTLWRESEILHIEALAGLGRKQAAAQRATNFSQTYPNDPLLDRLESTQKGNRD